MNMNAKLYAIAEKLGTDSHIPLHVIMSHAGMEDTLFYLGAVSDPHAITDIRHYLLACVRTAAQVIVDGRLFAALYVAEKQARGTATSDEIALAVNDADDALTDAVTERDAADAEFGEDSLEWRVANCRKSVAYAVTCLLRKDIGHRALGVVNSVADALSGGDYDIWHGVRKSQKNLLVHLVTGTAAW